MAAFKESVSAHASTSEPPVLSGTAKSSAENSAISHSFYPALDDRTLLRSLFISAQASGWGAMFFAIVQGTVFNFFLEDLSLRDRLPYFLGLWSFAGIGLLMGSWIQSAWGHRKALFLLFIGGSRVIWFAVGLLPIVWPDFTHSRAAFSSLIVLTVLFYFIHGLGWTSWLTWMADLVPPHLSGRYWSLRQVGCSATTGLAQLGGGYYLEHHRDMRTYAIIFCTATVFGLMDACSFIFVAHRQPKLNSVRMKIFDELKSLFRESSFRRLCMVYLLWSFANCIMASTLYFFMRDRVGMGAYSISVATTVALAGHTAFTLLWGRFSDRHGHRGPLIATLLLQAVCPVFYFLAHRNSEGLVSLGMMIGAMGLCGSNLFMLPMLINFTKRGPGRSATRGGPEVGMALFQTLITFANGAAYLLTYYFLYDFIGRMIGLTEQAPEYYKVYLWVMAFAMLLRLIAAGVVLLLPKHENETPPGTVISDMVTTNPVKATVSALKYCIGREPWENS